MRQTIHRCRRESTIVYFAYTFIVTQKYILVAMVSPLGFALQKFEANCLLMLK